MKGRTVAVLALAAVSMWGCGAPPAAIGPEWRDVRVAGDEVEHYSTMAEMAEASDAVFVGRVGARGAVRVVQGDAPEDRIYMGQLMLVSREDVAEGVTIGVLELLLPASTMPQAQSMVNHLAEHASSTDLVVFARLKQGEGNGRPIYRPVNTSGLWVDVSGTVSTPLTDDPEVSPLPGKSVRAMVAAVVAEVPAVHVVAVA